MLNKLKKAFYNKNVFINCPFDPDYEDTFRAIVYTVLVCGFSPNCTLMYAGMGSRMGKIYDCIKKSDFSIHDISRKGLDPVNKLPRFNMPFEYGLVYSNSIESFKRKESIVMDDAKYDYKICFTDISEKDVSSHDGDYKKAVEKVRNFLQAVSKMYFEPKDELISAIDINTKLIDFNNLNKGKSYLRDTDSFFDLIKDIKDHIS